MLRTKMALAALQCLVVVYRYADIVLAYPTFFKRSEENSQHCVRVTIPASFVSCTFSQRVFAEIHTFSSEFLVEPYVFLWMSLLREIFRTTFLKNRMSLTQPRQGQTVFRTKIARPTLCAHLVYGLQHADATPIIASSGSNTAPGAYLMSPFKKDYLDCATDTLNKTSLSEQCIGIMSIWF